MWFVIVIDDGDVENSNDCGKESLEFRDPDKVWKSFEAEKDFKWNLRKSNWSPFRLILIDSTPASLTLERIEART
jgi:hypothetical protein